MKGSHEALSGSDEMAAVTAGKTGPAESAAAAAKQANKAKWEMSKDLNQKPSYLLVATAIPVRSTGSALLFPLVAMLAAILLTIVISCGCCIEAYRLAAYQQLAMC